MADPLDYQVPLLPGLCTSQTTFDSYIQSLNLAMDMTVQVINEELGLELKLPGIPPIPLPKSPDIKFLEMLPWERNLRLGNTPVPTGYVGNVFPLRNQKKQVTGKLTFPGMPELTIPAPPGEFVQGLDPSKYVINLINQNLLILFDFLIEQGIEIEPIIIPQLELCGDDAAGGAGASPGQIIVNQILTQNLNNAIANLVIPCVPILPAFDVSSACWRRGGTGSNMTLVRTTTSLVAATAGVYPSFNASGSQVANLDAIPYDSVCHPYPCSNGLTLSFNWAYSNDANHTASELPPGARVEVGGSGGSNSDAQIVVSGSVRRVSDSSNVSGLGRSFNSGTGIAKNAVIVAGGTDRPSFSDSGTGSLVWTSAEIAAVGEPVYLVLNFSFRYLIITNGAPTIAQDATLDAEVTNLSLIFT